MKTWFIGLAMLALSPLIAAPLAAANDVGPALSEYLRSEIMPWIADPALIDAIRRQNAANSGLGQADIDALDAKWRAEVGAADTPTITPVISNAAAIALRARIDASRGTMTEAFVTDARGLNVAAGAATSDYWQGDEEKFTMTFPRGPAATHFGEVEFDESTQTYQAQISVTIADPGTNEPIGTLTVAVSADALH